MSNMFQNCESLKSIAFPTKGPEDLKKMEYIINGCSSLTSIDFSSFKLSSEISYNYLYEKCQSLIGIDFPNFDLRTSKLEYLYANNLLDLKYVNLMNCLGESEDFINFITNFVLFSGRLSLAFCLNDKKFWNQ